jgi:hypothetical protein
MARAAVSVKMTDFQQLQADSVATGAGEFRSDKSLLADRAIYE